MNTMIKYYNQNDIISILKEKHDIKLTRVTFWSYEKKGYIKPSGYIPNGSLNKPVYTEKELNEFLKILPKLRKQGKVRI